jgi:hypothetical protein
MSHLPRVKTVEILSTATILGLFKRFVMGRNCSASATINRLNERDLT